MTCLQACCLGTSKACCGRSSLPNEALGAYLKSFKALKAAWASIGIGLIIIALEELVANWDAISEALGFVDKEAERNAELLAEQDRAVRELNTSTRGYVQILEDTTSSEEARAEALNELNREFNGIIDLEADQATQLKQANQALAVKEKLERTYQTKPNAYHLARGGGQSRGRLQHCC